MNVKATIVSEPKTDTINHTLTHNVDKSDSTKDKSPTSFTTKNNQVLPDNINMDQSPNTKTSHSKETMTFITQTQLTALHDKISALENSIIDLKLTQTTDKAKISSQESTISALRLPLPSNPNEEILKFQTENTRLGAENLTLITQAKAAETRHQQFVKMGTQQLNAARFELHRRQTVIFFLDNKIIGMQRQLDSVYLTIQRQSHQLGSLQRQHARKLAAITDWQKEVVKSARKRALMYAKRHAVELVELMNISYATEDEETEDKEDVRAVEQEVSVVVEDDPAVGEGEAKGGAEMEIEVIDLIEDDEEEAANDDDEKEAVGKEEKNKDDNGEQITIPDKSVVGEKSIACEQSIVHDNAAIDNPDPNKPVREKSVTGGSSPPRKRVRL